MTVINHVNPKGNKIFITCDAGDWCTGGILSFGPTWEMAQLVSFDSMQLKGTEKIYPVHEKELLSIVRASKNGAHTYWALKLWSTLTIKHLKISTPKRIRLSVNYVGKN